MIHTNSPGIFFAFLQPFLGWLALLSFCTFSLSIILIPWLVGNLPQDYFISYSCGHRGKTYRSSTPSPTAIIIALSRNCLGILLILAGIVMLFLPGQGLLTILLGGLLLSLPGKQKLIYHLIANNKIQRSMDWLRKKRGKDTFTWP